METTLRVLLVEDSESDALFIIRTLEKEGYALVYDRVDDAAAMNAALQETTWDVILCDYQMPQFTGLDAIALVKASGLDIPLIIVSGVIGEETAVEAMKAGAADYVMKDNLSRLLPAIDRELRDAKTRHAKREAEEALRESEDRYRGLVEKSFAGVYVVQEGHFAFLNENAASFAGYRPDELVGKPAQFIVYPVDIEMIRARAKSMLTDEDPSPYEFRIVTKDGQVRWILETVASIQYKGKPAILGNSMDITSRKEAESQREDALEELRAKRDIERGILLSVPHALFGVENRYIFFANEASETVFGWKPDEMVGKSTRIIFRNEQEWEDYGNLLYAQLQEQPVIALEWDIPFVRKDGTEFFSHMSISRIDNELGERKRVVATFEDITDRRRADEELKKTLKSLSKALGATIQVLVSAVEARDPYTAGHQNRVADLACAIGEEMGFARDRIDGLRMAGLTHDLGKLSVPSEILVKPTRLTAIEFSLIREHSRSGYEILKDVESPWPLAEVAHQHHERVDGSGYPQHLKGEEIFIEARIMAVADVVESMASHRPYRPALGIDAALEEIERNKGILYDDAVAEACLRVFREKGFQLENT